MKILYGVQATGNGHITRARAMNRWLEHYGFDVDYVFSGRDKDAFWDMQAFGDWRCFRGLTFEHEAGKIRHRKTLAKNSMSALYADINNLDLSAYDIILCDYEPITAWAAKKQKRFCIGMGHQYAFAHNVPKRGDNIISATIMRGFAPVSVGLGLHWHHFQGAILPPITDTQPMEESSDPSKIVVYLGFEDPNEVIKLLEPFDDYSFIYYAPFSKYERRGHIQLKPFSREGFKQDLASSGGVICNAGFALASEAIQLGKKLLVKPLHGQMEQLSNAEALSALGLGMSMDQLDSNKIKQWLEQPSEARVVYPDVAKSIAEWLAHGDWENKLARHTMIVNLWKNTRAEGIKPFVDAPLPVL